MYLLAVPGFVVCFFRHICMCGHMAHIGSSEKQWELAGDATWFVPMIVAGVLGVSCEERQPRIIALVALVLLASRFLLRSGGGGLAIFPELPGLLLGVWYAVRHLAGRLAQSSCTPSNQDL